MKQDNDNGNNPEVTAEPVSIPYRFTFSFNAGGIIESPLGLDGTREQINANLLATYGPDAFELIEVREATEEEVEAVQSYLNEEAPTIQ